jgi:DNA-binding transcriptional ArsR family regulator
MDSPLENSPNIEPQQMQPGANVPANTSDSEAITQPNPPFEETKEWQDETPVEESESWDERPEATPEEVLTALSSIRRVAPPREPDVVLDINALTNLNNAETMILTEAVEREVSPSDNLLQEELEVGRPRLSQIFNGLLKSGILTVRKQGRSRMYRISSPAKDHLINLGAGGEF